MSQPRKLFTSYGNSDGSNNLASLRFQVDAILEKQMEMEVKIDQILKDQTELAVMLAESNVLLRRSLGMNKSCDHLAFPIRTVKGMRKLDKVLGGASRADTIHEMRREISGDLQNLERLFDRNILHKYNYDGTQNKMKLKDYAHLLSGLYEASGKTGGCYESFVKKLRQHLRRIKNSKNKQINREQMKMRSIENNSTGDEEPEHKICVFNEAELEYEQDESILS